MNLGINKKIILITFIIIIFAIGANANAQDEGILTDTQMLQRAADEIQGGGKDNDNIDEIIRNSVNPPEDIDDRLLKSKTEGGFSGGKGGTFSGGGTSGSFDSGFVPLQEIPGVIDASTAENPSLFFNAMFNFGIVIAGFLAVIMIAYGGIKYMSTDAIQGKSEGREIITAAIMGLLLILFSYILLKQINPDILKFDLFN